jgi:hypothetical protein
LAFENYYSPFFLLIEAWKVELRHSVMGIFRRKKSEKMDIINS